MEAKKTNYNEKWCGYFKDDIAAESHLKHEVDNLSKNLLIVSAKKELVPDERHHKKDVECHGLYLYKFTVVTASKSQKG